MSKKTDNRAIKNGKRIFVDLGGEIVSRRDISRHPKNQDRSSELRTEPGGARAGADMKTSQTSPSVFPEFEEQAEQPQQAEQPLQTEQPQQVEQAEQLQQTEQRQQAKMKKEHVDPVLRQHDSY